MKPILQALKKISFLLYSAPLVMFLLPYIGQQWGVQTWETTFKLAFMPIIYIAFRRFWIRQQELAKLRDPPSARFLFGQCAIIFGFLLFTAIASDVASEYRKTPIWSNLITLGSMLIVLACGFISSNIFEAPKSARTPVPSDHS
jgi:hypothetical protein